MQGSLFQIVNSMTIFKKNLIFTCHIYTKHQDELNTLCRDIVNVIRKKYYM